MSTPLLIAISGLILYYWRSGSEKGFYVPVPTLDELGFVDHNDQVQHLNKIAKTIDYLYRNFMRNRSPQMETLLKRIRPIFFEIKFEFAKRLYLADLQDAMTAVQLEIQIRRDQIQQIIKRIPPHQPFIAEKKYAPYFWILTEKETLYFLNRSSTYYSESLSLQELDDYIRTNSIRMRYQTLTSHFLSKIGKKIDPSVQDKLFTEWCHAILEKRYTQGQEMINAVRGELKMLQREKSRFTFQHQKVLRQKLSDWPIK
jgi:hypothetical protein